MQKRTGLAPSARAHPLACQKAWKVDHLSTPLGASLELLNLKVLKGKNASVLTLSPCSSFPTLFKDIEGELLSKCL